MRKFYLGIPEPLWLRWATTPTFLSHRRIQHRVNAGRRKLPVAVTSWALDSGGFTEVSKNGIHAYEQWPSRDYAKWVAIYAREIGNLDWAAIQDWMCEEAMLRKTGLTVSRHQTLTTRSYLDLMGHDPALPWIPVLQGFAADDYKRHLDDYSLHGVDLPASPVVGLGSVCRRQTLAPVIDLATSLKRQGLRVHGFGVNKSGLRALAPSLCSSDSMAWAVDAAKNPPLPGHAHKHCSYCFEYACRWRKGVDRILVKHSREYLFANPEIWLNSDS